MASRGFAPGPLWERCPSSLRGALCGPLDPHTIFSGFENSPLETLAYKVATLLCQHPNDFWLFYIYIYIQSNLLQRTPVVSGHLPLADTLVDTHSFFLYIRLALSGNLLSADSGQHFLQRTDILPAISGQNMCLYHSKCKIILLQSTATVHKLIRPPSRYQLISHPGV